MKRPFMKHITWYLVVAMFVIGITPRVYAEFSPSEVVGVPQIDRGSDLGKIQNAIETKMIGERLKQIGLTSDEILKKLSQLRDEQIHQLALQLDRLLAVPAEAAVQPDVAHQPEAALEHRQLLERSWRRDRQPDWERCQRRVRVVRPD